MGQETGFEEPLSRLSHLCPVFRIPDKWLGTFKSVYMVYIKDSGVCKSDDNSDSNGQHFALRQYRFTFVKGRTSTIIKDKKNPVFKK